MNNTTNLFGTQSGATPTNFFNQGNNAAPNPANTATPNAPPKTGFFGGSSGADNKPAQQLTFGTNSATAQPDAKPAMNFFGSNTSGGNATTNLFAKPAENKADGNGDVISNWSEF